MILNICAYINVVEDDVEDVERKEQPDTHQRREYLEKKQRTRSRASLRMTPKFSTCRTGSLNATMRLTIPQEYRTQRHGRHVGFPRELVGVVCTVPCHYENDEACSRLSSFCCYEG